MRNLFAQVIDKGCTPLDEGLKLYFFQTGGQEGIDVCTGDGGAPLVCQIGESGNYYQAGIVAAGIQCAKRDIPGLYTDVAKNREWIDDQMVAYGLEDIHYTI